MLRYVNINKWIRKFHYYYRKSCTCKNYFFKQFYKLKYKKHCEKHGIEIPIQVEFGEGLFICHPYNITINPNVKIGKNVNIHKGVTIGQENRGKRKGTPIIR